MSNLTVTKKSPKNIADLISRQKMKDREPTAGEMREAVKRAFMHAMSGYSEKAWGHDEIRPVSNATNDSWGGFGAVMIDAMDTMWVMGLKDMFGRAVSHIETLSFDKNYDASFFETTIRLLGGLLSAYELSSEKVLLKRALDLGHRLAHAHAEGRLPLSVINLKTKKSHNYGWTQGNSILAEFASFQLEFKKLSMLSGDGKFFRLAEEVNEILTNLDDFDGLFPLMFDPFSKKASGSGGSTISIGALGDSMYEYLIKQHILTNRTDTRSLALYRKAADGIVKHLIKTSKPSYYTYITELRNGRATNMMEHLTCFVPGMLILGAKFEPREKSEMLNLMAREITDTCVLLAENSKTRLAPDAVRFFDMGGPGAPDYTVVKGNYMLRPEIIESLFYLYRTTGDSKYRKTAWGMFLAIEKHCRTAAAYSGVVNVNVVPVTFDNSMQSFFLAETLKYLYLIFSDPSEIDLDTFVFTTEGHPLRISTPPLFSP